MSLTELKEFLVETNQAGYASNTPEITKERDYSTTITYQKGYWKMNDNFFGGEPYGGREVIFYKNKPVFIMTYYGRVSEKITNLDEIYNFLRSALKNMPSEYPYRGPKNHIEGNYKYQNNWSGEVSNFYGEEFIFYKNKQIYWAKYMGGLVDQRGSTEI